MIPSQYPTICVPGTPWKKVFSLYLVSHNGFIYHELVLNQGKFSASMWLEVLHSFMTHGVNKLLVCSDVLLWSYFLLIKSTEQSISVLCNPWHTFLFASPAPSHLFSRLESPRQLNCSKSVSHLILLIILVAFSWPFFQFCDNIFDVAEPHTVLKMQMHHRFIQLYQETPLFCSLLLS